MLIQCINSGTRLSRHLITSSLCQRIGSTGKYLSRPNSTIVSGKSHLLCVKRSPLMSQVSNDLMALRKRQTTNSSKENLFNSSPQHGAPPPRSQKVKFKSSALVRMLGMAKDQKLILAVGVVCLLISSAVTMSVPYSLGKMLDIIFNDGSEGDDTKIKRLKKLSGLLVGVFIIGGLANAGRVYMFNVASIRVVRKLRTTLYSKMMKHEVSWFDTKGAGELLNRLSSDAFFVGNTLGQNISDGLRALVMVAAGVAMMVNTSINLAIISTCVVPAVAAMAVIYARYVRAITRRYLDMHAQIAKEAEERLGNIRTVKAFGKERDEASAYTNNIDKAMVLAYNETGAKSLFFGASGFTGNVIIISVLYYGGHLVINEQLTVGALASFLMYATYTAVSIHGLSNFYTELNKGIGAAQRLWEILDKEYDIPLDSGIIPETRPRGEVKLSNVNFFYPSRPDSLILNNFNLTLTPGQTTAIVGRSGSGKTTIASLLLRFYDPQHGQLILDGRDLKTLSPSWLRSNIGVVQQEPTLFSGTIRENILYGLQPGEGIDDVHFQKIIKDANIDEFTDKLADGLNTLVGQRGLLLSGGQKQRVAIARALIRDPVILIFDEATSALDSSSEELVQNAIEKISKGRTVLIIAHRLSTIRNADKIAVLDHGRIIEEGCYKDLMAYEGGLFKELVKKQAFASVS